MADWEGYPLHECVFHNDIRRLSQLLRVNDVSLKDMHGIILFLFQLFQFYCQLYSFYAHRCENHNVNITHLLTLFDPIYLKLIRCGNEFRTLLIVLTIVVKLCIELVCTALRVTFDQLSIPTSVYNPLRGPLSRKQEFNKERSFDILIKNQLLSFQINSLFL